MVRKRKEDDAAYMREYRRRKKLDHEREQLLKVRILKGLSVHGMRVNEIDLTELAKHQKRIEKQIATSQKIIKLQRASA